MSEETKREFPPSYYEMKQKPKRVVITRRMHPGDGQLPEGLIYLACPYSHPDPAVRELRFEHACNTAAKRCVE